MKILNAQQVKRKMSEDQSIKLVMTLGEKAFTKCHIPGSLCISDIDSAIKKLPKNTEIIVYCSDKTCMASYYAYQQLEQAGYENIWRFAGGLMAWNKAGFALDESPSREIVS